ncbi:MAG TPA: S41 family peptidase [Candidatus Polarisedimenticolia bacterium]|nr:S41 family peptidase [Candidatus Polarisedimenticolia bacterium]
MDPATRHRLLEGLTGRLRSTYVFPKVGDAMASAIERRAKRGEYDRIQGGEALAESLTSHLRAVSHDTHVEVHYSPSPLPPMNEAEPRPETPAELEARRQDLAWANNGFAKVERLPGNLGLLDVDSFVDPAIGGDTAVAAMAFLSNCDALIVDLRYCPGGDGRMVALLCSYFADDQVHLVDVYSRTENFTKQSWSAPYVPGKRLTRQKVYILTSKRTHSAAEQFAFDLRNMKRATIVGETTRGGAHPVGRYRITENFGVQVPEGSAMDPVTKANWEGTGIRPDVEVPADSALTKARVLALESLVSQNQDPSRRPNLERALEALRAGAAR